MAKFRFNSRFNSTIKNHEKPQNKKGSYFRNYLIQRAENGTQTRDPQLGRLVLYRLSYFRKCIVPHTSRTHYAFSIRNGRYKQILNQQLSLSL